MDMGMGIGMGMDIYMDMGRPIDARLLVRGAAHPRRA